MVIATFTDQVKCENDCNSTNISRVVSLQAIIELGGYVLRLEITPLLLPYNEWLDK